MSPAIPSAWPCKAASTTGVNHSVINTGNVPLHVLRYYTAEGASTGSSYIDFSADTPRGKSWEQAIGRNNLGTAIKPGTETADLLGTVNVSFYYVGYDPATFVDRNNPGTELCRTETVSRVWKVRKSGGETDPELGDSQMTVTVETNPYFTSSDPVGYQLYHG